MAVLGGAVSRRWIDNPHPETNFRTLFLPVWYEGYAAPKWVWQSTGGSDAFEPKLSLWPLIFGTLKATLYAMLFSVPLALLAAIYVSQLAPSWIQTIVKPTVELMAAVPSVVVGFLAALWLAPRLESALLAVIPGRGGLPLAVLLSLGGWRLVPAPVRRRLPEGVELLLLFAVGVVVLGLAVIFADPIEARFFAGDFQRFLFTEWGLRYDQRNAIVVGLGLGFAVVPGDLHHSRGRMLRGSPVAGHRKPGSRRHALANRDQDGGAGGEPRAFRGGDARSRPCGR